MSYKQLQKTKQMENLTTTFAKAVRELMNNGLTEQEAKKEVKFIMNMFCDIMEKKNK